MNKEQGLLNESYKNYLNNCLDKKCMKENVFFDGSSNHHLYLKEEFINKCKTNPEFSENWGLKIEERELSLEERQNLYFKLNPEFRLVHEDMDKHMDKHNTPTRLITITYNDTKLESYE